MLHLNATDKLTTEVSDANYTSSSDTQWFWSTTDSSPESGSDWGQNIGWTFRMFSLMLVISMWWSLVIFALAAVVGGARDLWWWIQTFFSKGLTNLWVAETAQSFTGDALAKCFGNVLGRATILSALALAAELPHTEQCMTATVWPVTITYPRHPQLHM